MDNEMLMWVLAGAVLLSLVFSVSTLILQIKRSKPQSNKSADKSNSRKKIEMPDTPPVQSGFNAQQPTADQPMTNQPAGVYQQGRFGFSEIIVHEDEEEYKDETQSLFPPVNKPVSDAVNYPQEYVTGNGYEVDIIALFPEGEVKHKINVMQSLTIGRSGASGLVIDNKTVSGLQCVLTAKPDGLFVENKSASNITRLNGITLTDISPVKANDVLKMGKVQLLIQNIYNK